MTPGTVDVIIECIEVFINSILYIRKVYPEQIFQRRKIYNSPIYISIYPPLNDYILNVLKSAKALIEKKSLIRIELIMYKDELTVYESYIFEIDSKYHHLNEDNCNYDKYLIDFEEQIRKSLLTLDDRVKILRILPEDAKFKVNFLTTQSAFVKFSNDSKYQDFPWLQETDNSLPNKTQISILPVTAVESVGLQLYGEIY